jgi:hypothetical protein
VSTVSCITATGKRIVVGIFMRKTRHRERGCQIEEWVVGLGHVRKEGKVQQNFAKIVTYYIDAIWHL